MMAGKRKRRRGRGGGPGSPESLRPAAPLPDPQQRVQWVVTRPVAGVRVNEDTALTIPAVWAAVRLLSETLAALPWHVHRKRGDGGRDPVPNHPADNVIHVQANEETSAFHWREAIVAHALLWGNGYAEKEPDMGGNVAALWQITPDRVRVVRSKITQRIEYEVYSGTGTPKMIPPERMYHLKGLGFDGLVGYSVVAMAARSMGLAIAQESYGAGFFGNDATPGGILKTAARLKPEDKQELERQWFGRHGGPARARTLAILEGGLEWASVGMPNEDAQFLQSRQFSITDVARWFRVPPHKIADLLRATFSNIEQQELDFVIDSLMPWVRRLESEADMKLIAEKDRGKLFTKLNLMGRLRGDSAARIAYFSALMDRGILTANEVRQIEDMNPIGPDGDKRFVAMNMQLLEDAGEKEDPPPAPPPTMPPQQEEEEEESTEDEGDRGGDNGNGEDLRAVLARSLGPAWERLLERERSRLKDMARNGKTALRQRDNLVGNQTQFAREVFAPIVELATHLSPADQDAAGLVKDFVDEYAGDLRSRLTGESAGRWDGLSWLVGRLEGSDDHATTNTAG